MKLNMLSRAAALVVLTALPLPVLAAQPAAPSYLPTTPAVSDQQFEMAREVVELAGISQTFDPFIPEMLRQMTGNLTRTRPEIAADLKSVMDKTITPEFVKRTAEMVDYSARLVANSMSESELKETLAFLKTAAGKKYTAMQPLILNRVVTALDAWNRTLSVEMMDRVRAEMKKKGHDL